MRREVKTLALLAMLACLALGTRAQTREDEMPVWVEDEAPLPTVLRTSGLIPVMTSGSTLRFGIDPQSVSVGKDDVIRYVVVATSGSGALNAMQEGVRCGTREVKTYARYSADAGWRPAQAAGWRPLSPGLAATRHSALIARNGLCSSEGEPGRKRDAAQIVQDLRAAAPAN